MPCLSLTPAFRQSATSHASLGHDHQLAMAPNVAPPISCSILTTDNFPLSYRFTAAVRRSPRQGGPSPDFCNSSGQSLDPLRSSYHCPSNLLQRPTGSVVYPPERNAKVKYLLWLTEANRLAGGVAPTRRSVQRGCHPTREGARLVVEVQRLACAGMNCREWAESGPTVVASGTPAIDV